MYPAQLSLFESDPTPMQAQKDDSSRAAQFPIPKQTSRAGKPREVTTRLVTLDDMPAYPADVVDTVNNAIAALPTDLVWLTYRDVERHFGISRSTTARRLKDGLVPGIRFQQDRMLDDGPVRRLDRLQLRWLLLAVRAHRPQ